MKHKASKLLSILLALVLVAGLLPSAAFAAGYVAINPTNFPDANFREFVKQYDTSKDNKLSEAEIAAVTEVDCSLKNIANLTGIEYFTALTMLYCGDNQLASLDVSKNTSLTYLDCYNNQLTYLNVSGNTALTYLDCGKNQLTSLDVSKNTALKELDCHNNQLTALDVSNNTALEWLACYSNKLTSLDVSTVPAIKDAVKNGTKDTSKSAYDSYSSSKGNLLVDKTVNIVTDTTIYTITFDPNGGSGTMADVTVNAGEKLTLPACTFTPPSADKEFDKWIAGNPGEQVEVTDDSVIHAIWKDKSATKTLSSIAITTPPTKSTYTAGESFDKTGMVVTATYSDSSTAEVTSYTVTPSGALATTDTSVTVSYTEGDVTKTATQNITVNSSGGSGDGDSKPIEPTPESKFTDVPADAWYKEAVDYVAEKGLMQGTAANTFSPNITTTRAMIVTILYRLEGSPAVSGTSPFDDVASGQWYTDAVIWANSNGIVKGYGDGNFGPADNITREQMAAIMFRYSNFKGYDTSKAADLSGYTDASDISDWAVPAMKWANAEGLITGCTPTTLVPRGEATRAQAATILMRYIENVK